MIPPLIVRQALTLGLSLIAITDHNAAANCAAVIQAAEGSGLVVLPGMEVQSAEEVHVLCLFDSLQQALAWQGSVLDRLPDHENPEEVLGAQYVVDASGGHVRTERRLLLASTDFSLAEIVSRVEALGGLAIPAHIDRPSYSLLANLGFVPPDLAVPALEIFRHTDADSLVARRPDLAGRTLVRGGDAHRLDEVSAGIEVEVQEGSLAELRLALAAAEGRSVRLLGAPSRV